MPIRALFVASDQITSPPNMQLIVRHLHQAAGSSTQLKQGREGDGWRQGPQDDGVQTGNQQGAVTVCSKAGHKLMSGIDLTVAA